MIITFEVQIDPVKFLPPKWVEIEPGKGTYINQWEPKERIFTSKELFSMKHELENFVYSLEPFNEAIRSEMYVDQERYDGS